jgi:hypothetical protein
MSNKIGLLAVFIAASLFVGTFAVIGHDMAFAGGKKKVKVNEGDQLLAQPQDSSQTSTCFSSGVSALSCNNVGVQLDLNTGNNAEGQK